MSRIRNRDLINQVPESGETSEVEPVPDVKSFSNAKLSYESEPGILKDHGMILDTNIIHIFLSRKDANKLEEQQEVTLTTLKQLTANSRARAMEWNAFRVEADLKIPYVANAALEAIKADAKLIIVVDRSSAAEFVKEGIQEKLDEEFDGRIVLVDQDSTLAERQQRMGSFLGVEDNQENVNILIVPSEAVQQGYFDNITTLSDLDNLYRIVFFDILKNNPSAVTDFANLFRSSEGRATQVDYFAVSEVGSEPEPFYS